MNSFYAKARGAMATEFAHTVRTAELELAVPLLPPAGAVLELGAGDGWQARELHRRGFAVTAVDVARPRADQIQHFPVAQYDGRSLPFPNRSFDAVYSSNVLEHVPNFAATQRELARVLRPGGVAVHCVPSAIWRFWTTAGHPLYAARWALWLAQNKLLARRMEAASSPRVSDESELGIAGLLWRGVIPHRHGEQGNTLSEHWLFSRRGWTRRFGESSWRIERICPTHLFYTGNELLGLRLGNGARYRLASIFGSSTVIYVLRPVGDHSPTG